MLKSLKSKFSLSKALPPSDEKIRRHREQRRQLAQWQTDVASLDHILDKLKSQYTEHKGDFAIGRYEELKTMVKEAVDQTKAVLSANKDHRQTAVGGSLRTGAVTGMCDEAANFAGSQRRFQSDEERFAEMSSRQLEEDADDCRRRVLQLKADFRNRRERLERLTKDYEQSKQLGPPQRYIAMKDMVKDACLLPPSS